MCDLNSGLPCALRRPDDAPENSPRGSQCPADRKEPRRAGRKESGGVGEGGGGPGGQSPRLTPKQTRDRVWGDQAEAAGAWKPWDDSQV